MKKLLVVLALLFGVGFINTANAEIIAQSDFVKIDNIGMKLLKSNNIDKRLTFDFTNNPHQGIYPILADSSIYTDYNLHNNRVVSVNASDYLRMTSDDEIAALIAHNIAQGVNSYKGLMNGQFFWTKEILNGKANELKYDKQAVDYMVKAGYNPVAIITAYDKVGAEWRGVFWGRHQKVSTRMMTVYNQIKSNYPKYLTNNEFVKSDNYNRFIKANNL